MAEKRILFDKYEFPKIKGLEYLVNEQVPISDYLFVNEPNDSFSMCFEKDFPIFEIPENLERDYCVFELKRPNRIIKFFCPEKHENLDTAVWYFYVKLLDEKGGIHSLPGQVRVTLDGSGIFKIKGKATFIEILEQVKLNNTMN